MIYRSDFRRIVCGLAIGLVGTLWAAVTYTPTFAQAGANLTDTQRSKLLGCYNDMSWDSSACRKAGVTKRGEFFYGPLGTNNARDPNFNPELAEMLADCSGVNDDGYCDNTEGEEGSPNLAASATGWAFTLRQQGGEATCSLETNAGEITVGFMGLRSTSYRGFVSGLIRQSLRATWRVDDGAAVVADGALVDTKWVMTDQAPPRLLDEIAKGKELAVTSAAGERVLVSLEGLSKPLAEFNACRSGRSSMSTASKYDSVEGSLDALGNSSAARYLCAFRMAEVDGIEVPRAMMSDRDYVLSREVTRAAITFDLENKQFFVGDRLVEGAEFIQSKDKFPDGAVTMPFSSFYTAVSLVAATGAGRGLTAQHQAQLEGFMKQYSGATAQAAVPKRHVVFDAVSNGRIAFFDLTPSKQAVNFSTVSCNRS